jgi:hypothetical protein
MREITENIENHRIYFGTSDLIMKLDIPDSFIHEEVYSYKFQDLEISFPELLCCTQ